jgi:hypothetical protein
MLSKNVESYSAHYILFTVSKSTKYCKVSESSKVRIGNEDELLDVGHFDWWI